MQSLVSYFWSSSAPAEQQQQQQQQPLLTHATTTAMVETGPEAIVKTTAQSFQAQDASAAAAPPSLVCLKEEELKAIADQSPAAHVILSSISDSVVISANTEALSALESSGAIQSTPDNSMNLNKCLVPVSPLFAPEPLNPSNDDATGSAPDPPDLKRETPERGMSPMLPEDYLRMELSTKSLEVLNLTNKLKFKETQLSQMKDAHANERKSKDNSFYRLKERYEHERNEHKRTQAQLAELKAERLEWLKTGKMALQAAQLTSFERKELRKVNTKRKRHNIRQSAISRSLSNPDLPDESCDE
jgi:hypothetical protein